MVVLRSLASTYLPALTVTGEHHSAGILHIPLCHHYSTPNCPQNDPRRTDGVQIACAQQPLLAGQIEDALSVRTVDHG